MERKADEYNGRGEAGVLSFSNRFLTESSARSFCRSTKVAYPVVFVHRPGSLSPAPGSDVCRDHLEYSW